VYPGRKGPTWHRNQDKVFTPIAEITETDIVLSGKDEFGQIESGKLWINARFRMANSLGNDKIRLPSSKDKLPNWDDEPSAYKVHPSTVIC
jgi:hypothetical protein